jgi:hypothetical protein
MPMIDKPKKERCAICKYCRTYELWEDRNELMVKVEIGVKKRVSYFHKDCYEQFQYKMEKRKEQNVENTLENLFENILKNRKPPTSYV